MSAVAASQGAHVPRSPVDGEPLLTVRDLKVHFPFRRGLFGGQQGKAQAALDPAAGAATPGSSSPSGGGNLAREAGLDDIGGSNRLASYDNSSEPQRAALFDTSQYSVEGDEGMDGDDFDNDFGGGDDTA